MLAPALQSELGAVHDHPAPANFAAADQFAFFLDDRRAADRASWTLRSDYLFWVSIALRGLSFRRFHPGLGLGIFTRDSGPSCEFLGNMKFNQHFKTAGKIGWILLWLLGVPIPVLLIFFLLRGCT